MNVGTVFHSGYGKQELWAVFKAGCSNRSWYFIYLLKIIQCSGTVLVQKHLLYVYSIICIIIIITIIIFIIIIIIIIIISTF